MTPRRFILECVCWCLLGFGIGVVFCGFWLADDLQRGKLAQRAFDKVNTQERARVLDEMQREDGPAWRKP